MANSMTRKKSQKMAAKYGRVSGEKYVELSKRSKKAQKEYAKSQRVTLGQGYHGDIWPDKRKFDKVKDRQKVKAVLHNA